MGVVKVNCRRRYVLTVPSVFIKNLVNLSNLILSSAACWSIKILSQKNAQYSNCFSDTQTHKHSTTTNKKSKKKLKKTHTHTQTFVIEIVRLTIDYQYFLFQTI